MNAWEKIIRLRAEREILYKKIHNLQPKAVPELRAMGYSYDQVVAILGVGKGTAIKIMKKGKK